MKVHRKCAVKCVYEDEARHTVLFSHTVVSNSLWHQGLQYTRPPCPSPSPEACPSSCPLHQWCRPASSSSDALFSFCPQSFPASGAFPMSWLYAVYSRFSLIATNKQITDQKVVWRQNYNRVHGVCLRALFLGLWELNELPPFHSV